MSTTLDLSALETPVYVCDLERLEHNLEILASVQKEAGCKILLALKGFAMWSVFPLVSRYLSGTTASSLHEAQLAREHFPGELHAYAPALSPQDFEQIAGFADHVVFNSTSQCARFMPSPGSSPPGEGWPRFGLRVNPEHSEVKVPIYDPCAPRSRLGVTRDMLGATLPQGISGLHFHTLCELGADALERTIEAFEARFGDLLAPLGWINMGGGHHITRPDYDRARLTRVLGAFSERHPGLELYLEPGEAIALNTGVLVATVLDIIHNDGDLAILDTSASAHMPDVLEMPYRPQVRGAGVPGVHPHDYRLAGNTCLAGDVIGDYSFPAPLEVGQRLVFDDMAHYTMVKNTTFNGVRLPSIATHDPRNGEFRVVRRFDYPDYAGRLS